MLPRYFKPETLIETRCEHCGALNRETLARLYSNAVLICLRCGQEHTAERRHFRQTVDETEALVDSWAGWTDRVAAQVRNWWQDIRAR